MISSIVRVSGSWRSLGSTKKITGMRAFSPGFTENSVDLNLWGRYAINRNWAVDLGYNYTQVTSPEAVAREYTRNRVYGGVTFTF